jgi:hypothetical protein
VWQAVTNEMSRTATGLPSQLAEHFEAAFTNLRESAGRARSDWFVDLISLSVTLNERGTTARDRTVEAGRWEWTKSDRVARLPQMTGASACDGPGFRRLYAPSCGPAPKRTTGVRGCHELSGLSPSIQG